LQNPEGHSSPGLSPEREQEIRAFEEDEHRNVLTMGRDLEDTLAELDRTRALVASMRAAIDGYNPPDPEAGPLDVVTGAVLRLSAAEATVQRVTDLTAEHDGHTGLVPVSELENALGLPGGEW
jgi:hypothetical protein